MPGINRQIRRNKPAATRRLASQSNYVPPTPEQLLEQKRQAEAQRAAADAKLKAMYLVDNDPDRVAAVKGGFALLSTLPVNITIDPMVSLSNSNRRGTKSEWYFIVGVAELGHIEEWVVYPVLSPQGEKKFWVFNNAKGDKRSAYCDSLQAVIAKVSAMKESDAVPPALCRDSNGGPGSSGDRYERAMKLQGRA